ncbi:MAG: flavin-dependent monooxygenase [Cellvibrionaceae bacterium]|nr:flavin-dependent monooxygenase [Cellvibrionaceae bacterium]
MSTQVHSEILSDLLTNVRSRRDEFEQLRYIPRDVVEQFKKAGVYRAFVPKKFGGDEKTPRQFLEVIEKIAQADGSAGWVASFGVGSIYLSSLHPDIYAEIFKNSPDTVFAGCVFPPQAATYANHQYKVKGVWPYGSGSMCADYIGVGIKCEQSGKLPQMAVMPADQVNINQDSWKVHGMASTGSFDVKVDNVLVDENWVFERGSKSNLEGTIARYPPLSLATQVLAVTTLGIAREAVNMVLQLADKGGSITGAANIADRDHGRLQLAKAEAKIRSSRAYFYESIDDAWQTLSSGDELKPEQINMLRLSSTHLTRECTEVVNICYRLEGLQAAQYSNHMSRCYRDTSTANLHAFMGEATYLNAGAMLFGKPPSPGYL